MKRRSSIVLALVLFAATLSGTFSGSAAAQNEKALAKEAYDRGTKAHERGEFAKAAEEFARADTLAPSPIALQAALDAAVDADDPVLGAELLERSKRARATGPLASSIEAATKKLGGRAGRVKVACPSGAHCTATIDGAAFDSAKGIWMRPGPHTLTIQMDGAQDTRTVDVRAAQEHEISPARGGTATPPAGAVPVPVPVPVPGTQSAPPAASTPPSAAAPANGAASKPLSPIVFFVGAGLTVALAGASTIFGITAGRRHDEFAGLGCDKASSDACVDLKDRGERNQTIANIGFASTAAMGVATIVIGAVFTEWGSAAKTGRAPVIAPIAGGMALGYGAAF